MTDLERAADEDNPEGYYEWEEIKNLQANPEMIEQAEGKVTKVIDDNEVEVEIASGTKVRVVRAMIADVRTKGEAAA